jgi:hypothetical protein
MWKVLKWIIAMSKKNYCRQNILKLLDIVDEISPEAENRGKTELLRKMELYGTKSQEYIPFNKLKDCLQQLQNIMTDALDMTTPALTVTDEWTLYVARMTIVHDAWYDNKYQTCKRNPFAQDLYSLFILHMALRCKRRRHLIMEAPNDEYLEKNPDALVPAIHCAYTDFLGAADWFVVWTKIEPSNKPISQWLPLDVYRALQALMLSRTIGGYNFTSKASQEAFLSYREALIDRVAIIMTFEIEGSPLELAETRPTWFKPFRNVTVHDLPESRIGAVDHKIISRKIREEQTHRTNEIIEQMKADDLYDDSLKTVTNTMMTTEDRVAEIQESYEMNRISLFQEELKKLDDELSRYTIQKNLLQPPSEEDMDIFAGYATIEQADADEDEIERQALEEKIKKIQELKLKLEEKYQIKAEDKLQRQKQTMSNYFEETDKKSFQSSMATIEFAKALMLLVDSVMAWQLPMGQVERIPKYTEDFVAQYDKLFEIVCDCALRANRVTFLNDAQRRIVELRIQPCEREQYRQFYASGAMFSSLAVCQSVREPDAILLKDYQKTRLEEILGNASHRYHMDTLNYATWWTMGQLLEGINVDSSFVMMEFENDFLNLGREPDIRAPTIVRIGADYCLLRPGSWTRPNTDDPDVIWGTNNLLEALTYYFMYCKEENRYNIYDREIKKVIDIRGSQLYERVTR